jgi:hypothetical protein
MAATTNLYIDQGSDFSATITLYQDTDEPMRLSSANVFASMRRSYFSTTAYDFVTEIMDAANGIIQLSVPAATSSAMKSGRYVYDVMVKQLTGNTRVLEGIVTLYPEVTKL